MKVVDSKFIFYCSFCSESSQNKRLVIGPTKIICSHCLEICNEILADKTDEHLDFSWSPKSKHVIIHCDFCRKTNKKAKQLFYSNRSMICNECVVTCTSCLP